MAKRLNELFGQGFVTLDTLDHIGGDVFGAWSAFVIEWDRLEAERKKAAEHQAAMDKARKALAR